MLTAIENASITPASVEPCLPSLRKISPSSPSGCAPEVMYPSAPPTVNDVVRDARDFGSRLRNGLWTSTTCASGSAADRKSKRLNSSHANISYAVFCLKKKNQPPCVLSRRHPHRHPP